MIYKSETDFKEEFFKTFDPATGIPDDLLSALTQGYLTCLDRHDPERGSNNNTFGNDAYFHNCHELKKVAEKSQNRIEVISVWPRFRLKIGNFEIASHKVGKSEADNIQTSTLKKKAAVLRVQCKRIKPTDDVNQMTFPFFHDKDLEVPLKPLVELETYAIPFNLVLAHMGNPEQGLCAVYLCRPGQVGWEFTHLLWKRTEAAANLTPEPYEIPAPEQSPVPKLRRKKKAN